MHKWPSNVLLRFSSQNQRKLPACLTWYEKIDDIILSCSLRKLINGTPGDVQKLHAGCTGYQLSGSAHAQLVISDPELTVDQQCTQFIPCTRITTFAVVDNSGSRGVHCSRCDSVWNSFIMLPTDAPISHSLLCPAHSMTKERIPLHEPKQPGSTYIE